MKARRTVATLTACTACAMLLVGTTACSQSHVSGAASNSVSATSASRTAPDTAPNTVTAPDWSSVGPPLSSFSFGTDIAPANFLPNQADQPTGAALIALLTADHLGFVRLLDSPPHPQSAVATQLAAGGWKTIFDELDGARIRAVLLLSGGYTSSGQPAGPPWPPEAPAGTLNPEAGLATATWSADEVAILAQIKDQYNGVFPPALVGLEVANEPTVDATTIPMLSSAIAALHAAAPGLPVTIGGWRTPTTSGTTFQYNQPQVSAQVAPLVDFVSVHLYPDNEVRVPGGAPDRSSVDPSTYESFAASYLATVVAGSGGKPVVVGEFGGRSGMGATATEGSGGSPAHQAAVITAVTQAVKGAPKGVTGATVWLLEPHEDTGMSCDSFALICFDPFLQQPGYQALVQAASAG